MRGEIKHRPPNVGCSSLLWLRTFYRTGLFLKCPDTRYFFVACPAVLEVADNMTIPTILPGFLGELNSVFQVRYFIFDLLF